MSQKVLRINEPVAAGENAPAQRRNPFAVLSLQAVLILAALIALVPAVFMVITSFKTTTQYGIDKLGFPTPLTLENYQQVLLEHPFFLWMGNSAILSLGAVFVSTLVAVLAAYAIARMNFRGRELLLSLSTSLMAVPPVVMVVPLFVMFSQLKLLGTHHGVILIYAGLVTPFSVFLLVTFFRTIPTELIEAALIDGASPLGVLFRIILPLSGAPLVVGISVFQGRYLQNIPLSMAGMALASLPMLIIYIVFQRYFIRGLVAGAVKG